MSDRLWPEQPRRTRRRRPGPPRHRRSPHGHPRYGRSRPAGSVGGALGLTAASTAVWGVAHLRAGRRGAGAALMAAFAALLGGAAVAVLGFREELQRVAVQPRWLDALAVGLVVLALSWSAVVVRSYQVARPPRATPAGEVAAAVAVVLLVAAVCAPLALAARGARVLGGTIDDVFQGTRAGAPFPDRARVTVLLLGGDGAGNRRGVRPDSLTVASVDTRTGDVVLFGLPRNLQRFPVPARLRSRWPDGYTGSRPGAEGLLNELYQDAEENPALVPGVPDGRRGPRIMKEQVGFLLGRPVDFYVLVNLFGFRDLVDAVGGVRVRVDRPIPYGGPSDGSRPTGVIPAGTQRLDGERALWFARARQGSSDFARMARQRCLLKAISEQADPRRVLTGVRGLSAATRRAVSTDLPAELLPALVGLAEKARGGDLRSVQFTPPRFRVFRPDVNAMRRQVAAALAPPRTRRTAAPALARPREGRGGESLRAACG
ncbi:LCP family protein [Actinomadura kijaniata]|uniref:LCP family protein n=1 Tax=Actinomadura kijaniata TaxID=46161 RepID=UPI00082B86C8|nr:LCP family protein [Actinomadura kijaniata]